MSRLNWILLIIGISLFFTETISAQDKLGSKPMLNSHLFIPLSMIRTPFTNTKISAPLGFGQTSNFNFPLPIIGNDTLKGIKGEVVFATLGLQYRQRVRDWISFSARLSMTARLGTDLGSILFEGFNTVVNFEIGSTIRLFETKKIMLSTSFEIQNFEGNFVDISGFLLDVINRVPDPKVIKKVPALITGIGLHFAWGINQTFGLITNVSYSYGETFTRGQSANLYRITSMIDADLNPRFHIPIGFALSYTNTSKPDVVYIENKSAELWIWKVAYTGRKDFDFGIEYGIFFLPFEKADKKPRVTNFLFSMTYFFN